MSGLGKNAVGFLQALGPSYIYTGPELEPQNGALRDANAKEFFDTYDVQIVNGIVEVRRKKPVPAPLLTAERKDET